MKSKTGKVVVTSASALVAMALTLGMAPASQAAPTALTGTAISSSASTSVTALKPMATQSDPWASQTLALINTQRSQRGLAPLQWSQPIADVSQDWASRLGVATASASFDWAKIHRPDAGGSLIPAGASWYREVVVFNFSPQASVNWWMNSPSHRDAIMSPKATHIGIGHVTPQSGPYAGWNQMVANLGSYVSTPSVPGVSISPAGSTTSPAADAVQGTAKVYFEVNFRSGPSTAHSILQVVPQNGVVNVLGSSVNGWTKVSRNGMTGYISSQYIGAVTAAPAPAPEPSLGNATTAYEVNLRAGTSTATSILGVVPQGGTVNLLGASVNGWTKVSYAGKTGYISSPYLIASAAQQTTTTTYNVNLRAGASTGTSVLLVVPQNSTVNVLGASVNGWTKVSYGSSTGYISSAYLR